MALAMMAALLIMTITRLFLAKYVITNKMYIMIVKTCEKMYAVSILLLYKLFSYVEFLHVKAK